MAKSMFFPQFQGENSQFTEQKNQLYCATANCIFAFRILKSVNQLYDYIIRYEFSPFLNKLTQKIPNTWGRGHVPKKTLLFVGF